MRLLNKIIPCFLQASLRHIYYLIRREYDPEIQWVIRNVHDIQTFVDVGANKGVYTYFFSKHANRVVAFEPLLEASYSIRCLKLSNVTLHNVALSNSVESAFLTVPFNDDNMLLSRASLSSTIADGHTVEVDVTTLDSFNISDVSVIKIDVEGFEYEVIKGAVDTISVNMPILLVEIEQRHLQRNIFDVFNLISSFGYHGIFLESGQKKDVSDFDLEYHQLIPLRQGNMDKYVNNFIFVPD